MHKIESAFLEFDRKNPHVWALFCRFAQQMIERGHKTLSAKLIFERMRWEVMMTTTDPSYKLNNNFTAYYARKWNTLHGYDNGPQFALRYHLEQDDMDLQS